MTQFMGLLCAAGFVGLFLTSTVLMICSFKKQDLVKPGAIFFFLSILCLVSAAIERDTLLALLQKSDNNLTASLPYREDANKVIQKVNDPIPKDVPTPVILPTVNPNNPEGREISVTDRSVNENQQSILNKPAEQEPVPQKEQSTNIEPAPQKEQSANTNEKKKITEQEQQKPQLESGNTAAQSDDGILTVTRGEQKLLDTINIANGNKFNMVIFSEGAISETIDSIVTGIDGNGKPITRKLEEPSFTIVPNSTNAEVSIYPSYIGGLSFFPGEGGPFEVSVRAAPHARLGIYKAHVRMLWANDKTPKTRRTLMDKEFKFRIIE